MEAPKIPSFFKSRGARQFQYKPFYYDAAKEARELRNKELLDEMDGSTSRSSSGIESRLRARWEQNSSINRKRTNSNQRLILIVLILTGLAYSIYEGII